MNNTVTVEKLALLSVRVGSQAYQSIGLENAQHLLSVLDILKGYKWQGESTPYFGLVQSRERGPCEFIQIKMVLPEKYRWQVSPPYPSYLSGRVFVILDNADLEERFSLVQGLIQLFVDSGGYVSEGLFDVFGIEMGDYQPPVFTRELDDIWP